MNSAVAEFTQTTKLSGQYMVTINHADGSVTETPWMDNLILNSGMDDLGGLVSPGTTLNAFCHVGTGTSTPVVTQLALDAKIAGVGGANYTRVSLGSPTYKSELTTTYTFAQGAVVGNISEVGVSALTAGTRLFSRALFTSGGTPVAITVVALDQLTIAYKLTVAPPLTDSVGSVVIAGVTYGYTGRVGQVGSFFGNASGLAGPGIMALSSGSALNNTAALGAVTASGTGTFASNTHTSVIPGTYASGTYTLTSTLVWNSTAANTAGGVKGFNVGYTSNWQYYQYVLDAAIPKTNTNELRVNVTTAWARA